MGVTKRVTNGSHDLLGVSPREFTDAALSEPTHLWSDIILGKCGK